MQRKTSRGPSLIAIALSCVAVLTGCATAPRSEAETLPSPIQLTSGFARAGEGYFSPDARWIIFQASLPSEAAYRMFVAPTRIESNQLLALGRPIQISPPNSANTCGYFSPDGRSLIFASTGPNPPAQRAGGYNRAGSRYVWTIDNNMDIYRADGWAGALSAADPRRGLDLAQFKLTSNNAYDAECVYSPDGRHILFASNRDNLDPETQLPIAESRAIDLYVMQADGSNVVRLTTTTGYDGGAFFSPDGSRILYRSDRRGDDKLQIFSATVIYDADRNILGIQDEKQHTRDDAVNWGPFWHPNNNLIVYATSLHGHDNYELYLHRLDSDRRCRITFTPGFDGLPVFSPNAHNLLWASKRTSDASTQLFSSPFILPPYLK